MEKILVHMCCGPCSIYPIQQLKKENKDIFGLFYNPNIHPYTEFKRRFDTLETFAHEMGIPLQADLEYGLDEFLQGVVGKGVSRCHYCYASRLRRAAEEAQKGGFQQYTTTLLVSPYQNHDLIKELGEKFGQEYGVPFYYADFREGYREGTRVSREKAMYRQPYCGCIYSEKDRYYRPREGK